MPATIAYINGLTTGASAFAGILDGYLTNGFSSTNPRGFGWSAFYSDGYNKMYSSVGYSQSERLYLRLTASMDDTYIDRSIAQFARSSDGYMLNERGGDSPTRMVVGASQFEYWMIGNQDFIMITTLVGSTYSHYYCGLVNRFAPNQNSSLYGLTAPAPSDTTDALLAPFTISSNTTVYLRTGLDGYGGYDATNLCFIPGQKLYVIDQSLGTTTVNNQGIVLLNSVDAFANTINVSYVSGSNTFSSFAIIGVDPQPNSLNTGGTIRGNPFYMLDDYIGDAEPLFYAADEFSSATGLPPENIQGPDARGVYITMPIRLYNTNEIRGTLYGLIDVPNGAPGPQDIMRTFDALYQFIVFPDSSSMLAVGSII